MDQAPGLDEGQRDLALRVTGQYDNTRTGRRPKCPSRDDQSYRDRQPADYHHLDP